MHVSLETMTGLERKLTISIPAGSIDEEVSQRLSRLSKNVRIDGFRPGKAPRKVIRQRYGMDVRNEVVGDLMRKGFVQAVTEEKLNPAGNPKFELLANKQGEDLSFAAIFEVYPEVQLANLAEKTIGKPVAEVTDKDVDNMLDVLRKQQLEWIPRAQEDACQNGDKVQIDFEGFLEGEAFEGGKAEGHELVLGENTMIPGFEEQIQGMKASEDRRIQVTFPEDYSAENLKGKLVEFEITVKGISYPVEPELDQAFFSKYGVDAENLDAFKVEVRKNMERELRQALKTLTKNRALDALLEANDALEVPNALIDQEIHELQHQFANQYGSNSKIDPHQLPKALFKDRAEKRVKLGLLINTLIEEYSLQVDSDKLDALVKDIASTYQDPNEVIEYYKHNKEQKAKLDALILEEQAVEKVLELSKVTSQDSCYDDVVKEVHQNRS